MKAVDEFVFLNGRFVRAGGARVSVYDRGLLYGDGLFETMRAYGGMVFALDDHLHRLRQSADVLGIPIPDIDWPGRLAELLRRNRLDRSDAWVRVTITRGAGAPGLLPPEGLRPTVILMARPVERDLERRQKNGVAVRLLPYSRHGFIPEHKSLNYMPAVVGKALAALYGAHEGVFVRDDGVLTEGTTSSLFVVRQGKLATPPIAGILPGITREHVLALASKAGIPVEECELHAADLLAADEAFLSSSVAEIVPIVAVDDSSIGTGRPGRLTRRVQKLYRAEVRRCSAKRGTEKGDVTRKRGT